MSQSHFHKAHTHLVNKMLGKDMKIAIRELDLNKSGIYFCIPFKCNVCVYKMFVSWCTCTYI